jgi:hypothetical protein
MYRRRCPVCRSSEDCQPAEAPNATVPGPRRGEVVGQEVPGTSGAEVVENGVEDLSHVSGAGPSAAGRRWEQGSEDVPLGVGEVGIVGGARLGGGGARGPWSGLGARHGRKIPVSRRVGSIRVVRVDDDDSTKGLTSLLKLTNPLSESVWELTQLGGLRAVLS